MTAQPVHNITDAFDYATPRAEVVTVTPELAKLWLRNNTHNRPLRDKEVANYARDMEAGNWLYNGEAIKFATDGTVLDGQHRLTAIARSSATITMLIVFGLPPETQETMDAGRRRSTADAFGLRGEANSAVLASITRRVWLWENGDVKFSSNYTPTTAEQSKLLTERPELRRSAEIAMRIRHSFRYLRPSNTGTAHHLLSRIDLGQAAEFFARIGDGANLDHGRPVLTLRNRAMSDSADGHRRADHVQLAYLIRAWNAVREGRPLARIQQPSDAPMPMPK